MGRKGPRRTAPRLKGVKRWAARESAPWLQGPPEGDAPKHASERVRRRVSDPGAPPDTLRVEPGSPDGWRIHLVGRLPYRRWRLVIGLVLPALALGLGAIEPVMAVLPVFGFLAFLASVLMEESGPGREDAQVLSVGSAGVRCGDLEIPAASVRDVFWRETAAGEMALGVRGPNGEHEVARVPTQPAFAHGLSDAEREWIAEAIRAVGRANRGRSGTEKDVPAALRERMAKRDAQ
ncbi:MAG: hypothetical protein H6737_30425 [Alphaproteobacteria bacterium]|nr:hypothetical protein [Alphaproteobacteria bacterium]